MTASAPIDLILGRLNGAVKTSAGWRAHCPAHDDANPSLDVAMTNDGTVLLKCRSQNCTAKDITAALGLKLSDLFPQKNGQANDKPKLGQIVTNYDYRDPEGHLLYQVIRHDPKDFRQRRPDGKGGWTWSLNGTPRSLYRLGDVLTADPEQIVFVVEGERDADNLAKLGLVATCNSGGAGKWHTIDAGIRQKAFADRRVIVIPDHDDAGRKHAEDAALDLDKIAGDVRLLKLAGLPDKGDVSDWISAGGTAEQLLALAESAPRWPGDSYEPSADRIAAEPSMPADGVSEPPASASQPFPVDALPGSVRKFVTEQAAAIDCDPAAVALPALATLGGMIGVKRRVALKPGKGGWHEYPIIWAGVVARSGAAKSPGWEAAVRPAAKLEAELHDDFRREVERHSQQDGDALPPPKRRRALVSDCTVEWLAGALEQNPAGLLLARDELDGWARSFNQYKSRGGADIPNWLQLHRGGQVIVDRKNGTSVFVARGAVSICGTIQPPILRAALTPEARACGLGARLLLAMLPRRRRVWTEAIVSDATYQGYERVVRGLFNLPFHGEPFVVPLDPAAKRLYVEFFNEWNREADNLDDDLAAAWAKLEAYAPRLALIHHLAMTFADMAPAPIGEGSMAAGITLAKWFGREAERIYATLDAGDTGDERATLAFIQGRGGTCTPRDLQRWNCRRYPTSGHAEALLRVLETRGRGRFVVSESGPRGGRPAMEFRLT